MSVQDSLDSQSSERSALLVSPRAAAVERAAAGATLDRPGVREVSIDPAPLLRLAATPSGGGVAWQAAGGSDSAPCCPTAVSTIAADGTRAARRYVEDPFAAGHGGWVTLLAHAGSGVIITASGTSNDPTARSWDTASGAQLRVFTYAAAAYLYGICVSVCRVSACLRVCVSECVIYVLCVSLCQCRFVVVCLCVCVYVAVRVYVVGACMFVHICAGNAFC
jgi:hypothetical protein